MTSADRLAAEPPDTKQPPAPSGRPARSARNRNTWFSACTAPAASSHEIPDSDEHDTTMSNSSDAFVGAAGMNDKKRGLSLEITVGASTLTNWSITSAGEWPCSSMSDGASASRRDGDTP